MPVKYQKACCMQSTPPSADGRIAHRAVVSVAQLCSPNRCEQRGEICTRHRGHFRDDVCRETGSLGCTASAWHALENRVFPRCFNMWKSAERNSRKTEKTSKQGCRPGPISRPVRVGSGRDKHGCVENRTGWRMLYDMRSGAKE